MSNAVEFQECNGALLGLAMGRFDGKAKNTDDLLSLPLMTVYKVAL